MQKLLVLLVMVIAMCGVVMAAEDLQLPNQPGVDTYVLVKYYLEGQKMGDYCGVVAGWPGRGEGSKNGGASLQTYVVYISPMMFGDMGWPQLITVPYCGALKGQTNKPCWDLLPDLTGCIAR